MTTRPFKHPNTANVATLDLDQVLPCAGVDERYISSTRRTLMEPYGDKIGVSDDALYSGDGYNDGRLHEDSERGAISAVLMLRIYGTALCDGERGSRSKRGQRAVKTIIFHRTVQ